MTTRRLRAVDTPLDPDRADVITLPAPGKPADREHPALKPLNEALNWFSYYRRALRDGLAPAEADAQATEWYYARDHSGKGRRFTE